MKAKNFRDKIISFDKAAILSQTLKQQKNTIVTTNGCFDILHLGHIEYLYSASLFCDIFIVGINSDSSVRKLKGAERPLNSETARSSVIAALGFVDYCIIFQQDTPEELLDALKPDVHVKGGDYRPEEIIEKGIVEKNGGCVKLLQHVKGYSTTGIIGKMKS